MTLDAEEFIRRFLLHVLPTGFQRLRYYGLLGNRCRNEKLARCKRRGDGRKYVGLGEGAGSPRFANTHHTLTVQFPTTTNPQPSFALAKVLQASP
jgi:hypothetical protein